MLLSELAKEFIWNCKCGRLLGKGCSNYEKQVGYLVKFLREEYAILNLDEVKPNHIKRFIMRMEGKGEKDRVVPKTPYLSKWLYKYLVVRDSFFEYKDVLDYVFLSRTGKRLTDEALVKFIRNLAEQVGVSEEVYTIVAALRLIEKTTYSSYSNMINGIIAPYFLKRNITLGTLQASDIQDFYTEQLGRVKASSVIHYHANIHKALKYAVKTDLILSNPADKIERPKKERVTGSFYDSEEIN